MLVAVLAAVVVASGATEARADQPAVSPAEIAPNAAVVGIMQAAGQALLWDGRSSQYVVVRLGDTFQGLTVTAIQNDQVILTHKASNQHFILPRTSDTTEIARSHHRGAAPARPSADLVNPYDLAGPSPQGQGMAPSAPENILDPYNNAPAAPAAGATRQVSAAGIAPASARGANAKAGKGAKATPQPAPAQPSAAGSAAQPSTAGTAAQPTAGVSTSIGAAPTPVVAPALTPASPPPLEERHTVSRKEFDAAVMDFNRIGKEIKLELTAGGVQIRDISKGSLFDRWGLRSGDLVVSIADRPIRGVDDAAAVYAHLMGAETFVVKVKRQDRDVNLHYRFTK